MYRTNIKTLNEKVLEKLRYLAERYLAKSEPNPYQSEPYEWEIKDKKEILALADEFEASIK